MTDTKPQFKFKVGDVVWIPEYNKVDVVTELAYELEAPFYCLKNLGMYVDEYRLTEAPNLMRILWEQR